MAILQRLIEDILTTKENAYLIFCDVFDDLSDLQKETLHEEFKKEFNLLYFQYIRPKSKDDYNDFIPRYKKGKDDTPSKIDKKRSEILKEESTREFNETITDEYIAGSVWLDRRKQEITKIKSKLAQLKYKEAVNDKKYKNLDLKIKYKTLQSSLAVKQVKKLFEILSNEENPFIENCDEKTFLDVFSANGNTEIDYQAKIHWLKGRELFHYFFYFLHYCDFIDLGSKKEAVSIRLYKGKFFVDAEDKNKIAVFTEISKANKEAKEKRQNEAIDFITENIISKDKDLEAVKDFKELGTLIKLLKDVE